MFRDRTNLYLSYRRTIPRRQQNADSRFVALAEEEEGLMGSRRVSSNQLRKPQYKDSAPEEIEMKPIAPSIFDISNDLDENLATIKTKTNELSSLYKKLLITRDNEKQRLETRIEDLNYDTTKLFESCYVLIKKFEFLQKNFQRLKLDYTQDELSIIENYKKTYALKIQDSSLIYRNLQNNYIKFLKDDDDAETDRLLSSGNSSTVALDEEDSKHIEDYSKMVLQQAQTQIQNNPNSQILAQREREISKLAMGILEISTIFKEMETLIVDQGSMLDRIDYNISRTAEDLKSSDKELLKAQVYQKRTTKCKIIFLLSLIVLVLFIVIVVKPHGLTKVVEKPGGSNAGSDNPPERPLPNVKPEGQLRN